MVISISTADKLLGFFFPLKTNMSHSWENAARLKWMSLIIKNAIPRAQLHILSWGTVAICYLIHVHACNAQSLKEDWWWHRPSYLLSSPLDILTTYQYKNRVWDFILSCYAQGFQDTIDKDSNKPIVKDRLLQHIQTSEKWLKEIARSMPVTSAWVACHTLT